jgi:hypothetical protein
MSEILKKFFMLLGGKINKKQWSCVLEFKTCNKHFLEIKKNGVLDFNFSTKWLTLEGKFILVNLILSVIPDDHYSVLAAYKLVFKSMCKYLRSLLWKGVKSENSLLYV